MLNAAGDNPEALFKPLTSADYQFSGWTRKACSKWLYFPSLLLMKQEDRHRLSIWKVAL
jgi:hypothetical protein